MPKENDEPGIKKSVYQISETDLKDHSSFCRKTFLKQASLFVTAGIMAPACFRSKVSGQPGERLDRENLLIYRDEYGTIKPVQTVDEWQYRRQEIMNGMQEVMGSLPEAEPHLPLDLQIHWEVEERSYQVRFITYVADAGDRVPAFLLIPNDVLISETPGQAILSPLGTGQSRATFSEENLENEIFVLWNDHRDWPRELVELGYIVLIPAYPHLGEYRPDLQSLGYQSGTMKAIWNNIRGLDLLDQLPFVRSGRYGTIGHSLGGHNSIYTAVFDERLKVVVSSCGFDSYRDYMDGDISGWSQERYMPRIEEYKLDEIPFDFHEMIGALAPRVFYSNSPLFDSNFKWRSAARIVETAMQIYELNDVPERLMIDHPDAEHSFPDEQRQKAYRLFEQYLS